MVVGKLLTLICPFFQTRVFVTHAITYLPQVDHILVINDGKVSESGSYKELLAKKGAFADFLVQYFQDDEEEEESEGNVVNVYSTFFNVMKNVISTVL